MRLYECIEIDAPREDVWAVVSDADQYPTFMAGVTRWNLKSGPGMGLGARIDMRMAVGSAQVGSLIEVVEFDEPADLAWTSVTGIDQRGRWRLRELDDGRTKITLRLAYQAPGGLVGWLTDRVAARGVQANLRRAVHALKDRVEDAAERAGDRQGR
ncbi:MAG: cyclase/dehydrase [Acidimicrobiales bacterium]|nr:cyclase/dehydrase [Acidimicrobiales bacterium]